MNGPNSVDLSNMSMLDIFQLEAENQCTVLSDGLLDLEQRPDSPEVLERLMRAAHSVKGAARIIGLDGIVGLAHAMEDVFVAAQQGKSAVRQKEIDILFQGIDFLIDLSRISASETEAWLAGNQARAEQLVQDIRNLVEAGPDDDARTVARKPDAEEGNGHDSSVSPQTTVANGAMLVLFQQELATHGKRIKDILADIRDDPDSLPDGGQFLGAIQAIKGAAHIVELSMVEAICDEFVRLTGIDREEQGELAGNTLALLQRGCELLDSLTGLEASDLPAYLEAHQAAVAAYIAECEAAVCETGGSDEHQPASAKQASIRDEGKKALSRKRQPASGETRKTVKGKDGELPDRSVRVSAEGMNRLMGLAGEVQVESRWLPDFSLKMSRLKNVHDELYRLKQKVKEQLLSVDRELLQRNAFGLLAEKVELARNLFNESLIELEDHARRSTEISHRLYHEVIANRMRPFLDGIRPFPRMIRDLARELGKEVQLEIVGDDTKVDRDILEKMEAPLNHLLRNALDHGIEYPEERVRRGKSRQATIRLEARHSSGMLNILVEDDGCGIDLERLREKVIAGKMVTREIAEELGESELLEFLFLPGFSTREEVSSVSGRGVGLDVVHSTVHEVRGIVRVNSVRGMGTVFEMQLPITLSVLRALLVSINNEVYAFPLVSIDHVLSIPRENVREIEGRPYITFHQERIGLVLARQVLDQAMGKEEPGRENLSILVISDRHNSYGLIVDGFSGVRDLVVQPLDRRLGKLQDISAAAILEDGCPVLIVDVEDVVRSIDKLISGNRLRRIDQHEAREIGKKIKRILVADDSITVREVERKMLSARGYEVEVSVDGMDALNNLRKSPFDLVVTDVDMPRLDGIELVSVIKNDIKLKNTPIIIVSYKDRPEDKERGLHAGADYYLTKGSFQDETLVKAVEDLIGLPDEVA